MCGIAGIINISSPPQKSLMEIMCGIMKHRGPDGEGYYMEGPIALGHRRLSIIDLEGGKQPLSNEDGTVWITYNGEIYNFPELRKELIEKGHRFKTKSDTETIVHAYEEYGVQCLEKLRGMFAFGIWDDKKKRLFLARDRLGKKPLYYYLNDKKFIFASELKAILQDKRVNREINSKAIADYLTYNYIPFPETIFKGIYKLPPAHFMTVKIVQGVQSSQGDIKQAECLDLSVQQYWDIKYEPDYSLSEDDWADALRENLKEAVRLRLISDVPLGAFLSGGIDSSTVVALMSMVQDTPVKTFSIGFKEEDFSEVKYARDVSKIFGTEHHEMIVEPDAMGILPDLAWEFDEPFADSSAIPTYYVSKMARQHVTVILSGDGGDEIFAGYRRYLWARDMHRYDWLPITLKKILFGIPAVLLPDGMKGKGMLTHLSKSPFERYAGLNTFSDHSYLKNLLSADVITDLKQNYNGGNPNYAYLKGFYDVCKSDDYLTKIQYMDTKTYLADDILTKVDRASMLCSLETRAPLLDHKVVELAARIPSSLKINNNETKYILKKAMKGILPDEILYRKKMGFGVPLLHWFKKDLAEYARDILLSKKAVDRNIFNQNYIQSILKNHQKKGRDLSARIWALLFFEHWCRNWIDA
ncbi:MAG: asparagine synthase (glutamine-hydrolyzing) [Thermodesulfovibrionia bacterium]|nr:asparagine synthase (glutamine-hydrolyzing) [Thermodesulfovibrionia bacterium]